LLDALGDGLLQVLNRFLFALGDELSIARREADKLEQCPEGW
jgi:hypothetical protein